MKSMPTMEQWKSLYQYAEKIKKLAPWERMCEFDIFGLSLPEYEENFYISILGNASEHYAVCVLQGDLALGVFDYLTKNDIPSPGLFFYMTQLQISYEDRKFCEKQDLKIIKELGLKFHGFNDYPIFRAMHAGYLPYFIDKSEAQILLDVLQQIIEVLERFAIDDEFLFKEENKVFFRVKTESGDWRDEYRSVPKVMFQGVSIKSSETQLEEIMNQPRRQAVAELELYPAPITVKDDEGRPYVPLSILIGDQQTGGILAMELLQPGKDFLDFMATLPTSVMNTLQILGVIPTKFQMTHTYLTNVFQAIFQQLSLELEIIDRLPTIEMIKESMEHYFQSLR